MNTRNNYLLIAGLINLTTFFLHLIGGQIDLVDPMMHSALPLEKTSQLLGAWHMVTIVLLATSYVFISAGLGKKYAHSYDLLHCSAYLNLSFCIPFLAAGFYYGLLVPQWVFFLPIGVLGILGVRKMHEHDTVAQGKVQST